MTQKTVQYNYQNQKLRDINSHSPYTYFLPTKKGKYHENSTT